MLAALPAITQAQTLVHVTPCGPLTLPTSPCSIPSTGTGNMIVVGIQLRGANTSTIIATITDNIGNNYAEAGAVRSFDTGSGSVADIWFARNSKPGATTLTISPSSTVSTASAVIWEYSGVNTTAPVDGVAVLNSQSASTAPKGASITTAYSNEVVISLAGGAGSITGISTGNPFVNDATTNNDGWAHLVTTSAGTSSAQWSQSPSGTFASSTAAFKASGATSAFSACDLNQNGVVDVVDVQLGTNMYLGLNACTANIAGSGVCSALIVPPIENAALPGGTCVVASSHSTMLSWTASTTQGVNYNVYRSSVSGGPYTKVTSTTAIAGLSYTDSTVLPGQKYYYVVTAINSSGESGYSNEAVASVPFP
jgi:hypothetical protein